jgi:hypothetical protein
VPRLGAAPSGTDGNSSLAAGVCREAREYHRRVEVALRVSLMASQEGERGSVRRGWFLRIRPFHATAPSRTLPLRIDSPPELS